MKKKLLALSLAAFSGAVVAETPFSFTYVEVSHFEQTTPIDIGLDDDDVEASGEGITGSIQLGEGALLQLHYIDGEIDEAWGFKPKRDLGVDIDYKEYGAFIGGIGSPNAKTSFFGGFGYERESFESDLGDIDSDVYKFGGGVRYWLIPMVELNASVFLAHIRTDEENDNDAEASVGVRFQPIKLVSVGATYARQIDAESDITKVDVRLQF